MALAISCSCGAVVRADMDQLYPLARRHAAEVHDEELAADLASVINEATLLRQEASFVPQLLT